MANYSYILLHKEDLLIILSHKPQNFINMWILNQTIVLDSNGYLKYVLRDDPECELDDRCWMIKLAIYIYEDQEVEETENFTRKRRTGQRYNEAIGASSILWQKTMAAEMRKTVTRMFFETNRLKKYPRE